MTTPFQALPGRLEVPVDETDHIRGPAAAPVTLLEYGDYQCPYCGIAHPIVAEVMRRRPAVVRFAFRHFPLTSVHPYADVAAETAEAAGARGRFWQMHDWLFTHQERLDPAGLAVGAAAVGLDPEDVLGEVRRHERLDKVRRDLASGLRSGVRGTPTFFVNGRRHEGSYALTDLLAAVDDLVRAA
jgi:protein-disulfide isomerase